MSNEAEKKKQTKPKKDRGKPIKLAALNIAMHQPHSAEHYVQLLQGAFDLRAKVSFGELHVIMLGQLDKPEPTESNAPVTGEIFRFVKIDSSDPWFDTKTNKPANENEVRKIHLPEHLLPHLQRVPFAFFPNEHKLVFVSEMGRVGAYSAKKTSLSPRMAQKFFQKTFANPRLLSIFGCIHVTPIPHHQQIKKILELKGIKILTIELTRPNPGDDADDESERLVARMEKQNVKKQITKLEAEENKDINPDKETQNIAKEAAQNGKVEAKYKDPKSGRLTTISTIDRPRIEPVILFESVQSLFGLLKKGLHYFENKS